MPELLETYQPWAEWPEAFGDTASEYAQLHSDCAWLPLARLGFLRIEGKDAGSFLHGLLTADIRGLLMGKTREAFALDAQGKILFHLLVHRQASTSFLIEAAQSRADALLQHLDKYLIMESATLSKVDDLSCITLQGKEAAARATGLASMVTILNADRCGLGGVDLVFATAARAEVETALIALAPKTGTAALELTRTEHFLPRFGLDIEEGNNPLLYGKGGDRIAYTKGCFLGQETVARTRDRGHPPKRMVQVQGEGPALPLAGTELLLENRNSGAFTSALWSPTRQAVLGFALIKYADAVTDTLLTDTAGHSWRIVAISEY